ncbi:MAG: acyltransferase [Chitinophagaceae bacterium]
MVNATHQQRFFGLDALRGISAFAVVLFHYTYGYDNGYETIADNKFYFKYGYLGVNLFFMISGFVIAMTLEKTKDSKTFITSRLSRLYPAYWAAIIITVLLTALIAAPIQRNMYNATEVMVNFTMLQAFLKVKHVSGSYWTLAIELTFNFWMWFIFITRKTRYMEWICLAWLIICVAITAFHIPFGKYLTIIFIVNYAPLFIGGILFYLIKKRGGSYLLHAMVVASMLASLYIAYIYKPVVAWKGGFDIIPYILSVFFYVIFYLFIYGKWDWKPNKILLFMGSISYSLYLIHENIGYGLIYWLKRVWDNQLFYLSVTVLAITALAYLMYRYVEKPAMIKLRQYFSKKETNAMPLTNQNATAAKIG